MKGLKLGNILDRYPLIFHRRDSSIIFDHTVILPLGYFKMASYAFLYLNHGEGLHVGGEHNAERLDGGKNTDVPNDRRRRDVIRVHYIIIIINTQALAPEDNASTVLPQVVDGDIPSRVVLPCDRDGTVRVNGGFLAAQNGCRIHVRLDPKAILHVNRQLHQENALRLQDVLGLPKVC